MGGSKKVLLFISKQSTQWKEWMERYEGLIAELEKHFPVDVEVVDVFENPERAEEKKVNAVPVMIFGKTRFIGCPDIGKILSLL